MSVTVHDIAREAKVSIGAVSKALNGKKGVSDALRTHIKGIASRLQYRPYQRSNGGSASRDGDQQQIICVFGRAGWHLLGDIHLGIDAALQGVNYLDTRISVDPGDMLTESGKKPVLDRILKDDRVVGALFAFVSLTNSDIARFRRRQLPFVQLNHVDNGAPSVFIDDFAAAYDATSKFIERGHRVIGLVLPNEFVYPVWRQRLEGYRKALRDHGISSDNGWVGGESTFEARASGHATHELLVNNPKMTAILYASDSQALGGLRMLREMHIKVPEQVAVMGFDNTPMCELVNPPLASVSLPFHNLGKTGMEVLLECIRGKKFASEKHTLKAEVVMRRSADASLPSDAWL